MSKIDRLIGERVFGWSVVVDSDGDHIWSNCCDTPFDFQYASTPLQFGPRFSTDIGAAWEVVKRMRKLGFCIDGLDWGLRFGCNWPKSIFGESIRNACLVQFSREAQYTSEPNNQHDRGRGSSPEPEMSICLAALEAVGVSESEIQEALT